MASCPSGIQSNSQTNACVTWEGHREFRYSESQCPSHMYKVGDSQQSLSQKILAYGHR